MHMRVGVHAAHRTFSERTSMRSGYLPRLFSAAFAAVLSATPLFAQTTTVKMIPAPADVAAPPADAKKTASGLATKIVQPGTGKDHPKADEMVAVHYTGWTTDGKMFDSSVARGT